MNISEKPVISIIGLGLLGTSLGMALRGGGYFRLGWTRRPEIRRWAIDHDVLDETCDTIEEVLNRADLTVLALPIPEISNYIEKYAQFWRSGAVVTDLGSVKSCIMSSAAKHLIPRGVHFIGSHPMAGNEKSGPESAIPGLYNNADVFLCSLPDSPTEPLEFVETFWQSIGSHVVRIEASLHDELVAYTSHVPHIIASSLVLSVLDVTDAQTRLERSAGCAGGFRDTSRIASSNPAMWREIIEHNRAAVLAAMQDFEKKYNFYKQIIESGDFDQFEQIFTYGKILRDHWLEVKNKRV